LLPLLVIEAAGGEPRTGLPLAVAADCLVAASDVLDDVEDGDSQSGLELSESGYLDMVEAKSGAVVEGLCRAAAIVAATSAEAIECYARFGRNLGMSLQISNDLRAISIEPDRRNDLSHAKRTLSLAFAMEHAPTLAHTFVAEAHTGQLAATSAQRLRDLLADGGGTFYASVVADAYLEEAWTSLDQAGCPDACGLRTLLHSMRG
jgi:geranylgeranyl pyrophosphate synthase